MNTPIKLVGDWLQESWDSRPPRGKKSVKRTAGSENFTIRLEADLTIMGRYGTTWNLRKGARVCIYGSFKHKQTGVA